MNLIEIIQPINFIHDYLLDFYGRIDYFNLPEIAKQVTPKLLQRLEYYTKLYLYQDRQILPPDQLQIVLKDIQTYIMTPIDQYDDCIIGVENDNVYDLFEVITRPLNIGCNGRDSIDDDRMNDLNVKYNKIILSWLLQSYSQVNL